MRIAGTTELISTLGLGGLLPSWSPGATEPFLEAEGERIPGMPGCLLTQQYPTGPEDLFTIAW